MGKVRVQAKMSKSLSAALGKAAKGQAHMDRKKHIQEVVAALENDETDELLDSFRNVIARQQESQSSTTARLPRGVRLLKDVKEAVVHRCLVKMAKRDLSVWANLVGGLAHARRVWLRGLNAPEMFRLPELRMLECDFVNWALERYRQEGDRLQDLEIEENDIDWDLSAGVVLFVVTEQMSIDDQVHFLINTETQIQKPVPPECNIGGGIKVADIGEKWWIEGNYTLATAKIRKKGGASFPLAELWVSSAQSVLEAFFLISR